MAPIVGPQGQIVYSDPLDVRAHYRHATPSHVIFFDKGKAWAMERLPPSVAEARRFMEMAERKAAASNGKRDFKSVFWRGAAAVAKKHHERLAAEKLGRETAKIDTILAESKQDESLTEDQLRSRYPFPKHLLDEAYELMESSNMKFHQAKQATLLRRGYALQRGPRGGVFYYGAGGAKIYLKG